jgi:hypothetical protein
MCLSVYFVSQLDVRLVGREVNDWATSTDVKYRYIIIRTNVAQGFCVFEKSLGSGIIQEALALFIVFEKLRQGMSSCSMLVIEIGAVITSTLEGSTGGFGPRGAAKSRVK